MLNYRDLGLLVHECTHAYLDILDFGEHPRVEEESVAYVAEAIFMEASGKPAIGWDGLNNVMTGAGANIRKKSHPIASDILRGAKAVSQEDARALMAEVAKDYDCTVSVWSDGMNGAQSRIMRFIR